jgi:preprotein translocase subunit SecA
MTKSFGRGTDFIVFDESILSLGGHGGLHVIQTFLSVEISEEIQIQGRTARQGDPGTYILIIKNTDL